MKSKILLVFACLLTISIISCSETPSRFMEEVSISSYVMMIPTIDGDSRQAGVLTSITVNNAGITAWVPKSDEIDPQNLDLLVFNLPLDFTDLSVESDLPAGYILETDSGFAMTNAIPPGESQILVSYVVPYKGDGFNFDLELQLDTERVRMFLPAGEGSVASEFLKLTGSEIVSEKVFVYAEGGPISSTEILNIAFTSMPGPHVAPSR
jgi:hypothetical protein